MARYFTASSSQVLEWSGTVSLSLPFTLACWAYRPVATTEHGLISLNGNANGRAYSLAVMSSSYGNPNVVRARHSEDPFTGSETASPANSTTGTWQHYTAIFTTTGARVAASNGSFGTTDTGSVSALTLNSGISIGALFRAANRAVWGNGGIAIPAFWNGALSTADALRLAQGAWPMDVQSDLLVALWPLDEKAGGARDVVGGYNLTASASEPTWVPDPPVLVRRPARSRSVVYVSAGGGDTLLPGLFSNSNTFHAPTVSPGAVGLSPPLHADADTFHAATVAATYSIAPGLYSDADAFHSPTASASYSLAPGLYSDADAFHSATVSASYTLTPGLYSDADTFFGHVVSLGGALTLSPGLYVDADTFHSPTVGSSYAMTAGLYADVDAFYGPTISTTYALSPALYSDADTFHSAIATSTYAIAPALFADADTFFGHVVSLGGSLTLAPNLYVDADTFHAPTVSPGAVTLAPGMYIDADVFYTAAISGGATLVPPFNAALTTSGASAAINNTGARGTLLQ